VPLVVAWPSENIPLVSKRKLNRILRISAFLKLFVNSTFVRQIKIYRSGNIAHPWY
jgi:hypothetical protein